jgi:hypothetical protein
VSHKGILKLTETERFQRLKRTLEQSGEAEKLALLDKLNGCEAKWKGSYECLSPACPGCRRRNVGRQKRETVQLFNGIENSEAALVTILLPGCRDVKEIGPIMTRAYDVTRKRIAAARVSTSRWDSFCARGWGEIDAIEPDNLPLLFSGRAEVIPLLAPVSTDQTGPTWLPTIHAVAYLGSLSPGEVASELQKSWKLPGQVNVKPFDRLKSAILNLQGIASYANKFTCTTDLKAEDVVGGKVTEPWPSAWEGSLFSYFNSLQRNAFEFLRMSFGQKSLKNPDELHYVSDEEDEPMPVTCSFSVDYTRNILGGRDAY